MEITHHLPVRAWYTYDTEYWGLDYPPLMAYIEKVLGAFSHAYDPASVALDTSRGYEEGHHRAFMRFTVLVIDALVGVSAFVAPRVQTGGHYQKTSVTDRALRPRAGADTGGPRRAGRAASHVCAPLQHSVMVGPTLPPRHRRAACRRWRLWCPLEAASPRRPLPVRRLPLGLTLWSALFIDERPYLASLLFTLALHSKQTALYYAPAVFCDLLGEETWRSPRL